MRLTTSKKRYLHTLYFERLSDFIDLVESISDDYDKYNIKHYIMEINNLCDLPFKVQWYEEKLELNQIAHNWYKVYIFTDCEDIKRFWIEHPDELKPFIANLKKEI